MQRPANAGIAAELVTKNYSIRKSTSNDITRLYKRGKRHDKYMAIIKNMYILFATNTLIGLNYISYYINLCKTVKISAMKIITSLFKYTGVYIHQYTRVPYMLLFFWPPV